MRKYLNHFFFLFFLLSLLSCYNRNTVTVEKPNPLYDKEKFIQIMTDIQLAEGIMAYNRSARKNNSTAYKDSLYNQIFRHYGITASGLTDNLNYYDSDPDVMEEIYDKVIENISKLQSEILIDTLSKANTETPFDPSILFDMLISMDSITIDTLQVERVPQSDTLVKADTVK